MREWNIAPGSPLILTLAADSRLVPTDYSNDQIWQLSFQRGDPPAVSLYTTYGLRARSMRMFPRFFLDDMERVDPVEYEQGPVLRLFYPNYMRLEFSPFSIIDAQYEVWVPESHGITGRISLTNTSNQLCQVRLDWVCQLTPTDGERMSPKEMQAVSVLAGSTAELAPVVFLTAGPTGVSSPYPALCLDCPLEPGESQVYTWVHAARSTPEESFDLARELATRQWEAEIARIELINTNMIEVHTGDHEWDLAFALSQKIATGLFVGPTSHLPAALPVLTRLPDQGYSLRRDGTDYNHLWNGLTPLDAAYLEGLLMPGGIELVKDLVRNFIAVQEESGFIDLKPGLAGQRSKLLATPLLAKLAWRVYQYTQDRNFVSEVFLPLFRFFQNWFTSDCDRDGDEIPEWDHPIQAGLEDHPVFSPWHSWSQGVDIDTAESPALCAMLYQECQALLAMAGVLGEIGTQPILQSSAERLRTAIDIGWDEAKGTYLYWDRDTHLSPYETMLAEQTGSGRIQLDQEFQHPVRLQVRIYSEMETKPQATIFIHGESASGQHRVERLEAERLRWYPGRGLLTGKRVYSKLECVDIQDVPPSDRVVIFTVGYREEDQSLLLPLWNGLPSEERGKRLVEATLLEPEKFWRPYGLVMYPDPPARAPDSVRNAINLPLCVFLGEGLLAYGYRAEAAELVIRLMSAVTKTLGQEGCFRRYYQAETGQGAGDRDALSGLAPLGLFLDTLGVRVISPSQVALEGYNPFPWPVTVKYKGLTVLRQMDKTIVVFPDGHTATVEDPEPQIISLAASNS